MKIVNILNAEISIICKDGVLSQRIDCSILREKGVSARSDI